jgi:hypothetical protein
LGAADYFAFEVLAQILHLKTGERQRPLFVGVLWRVCAGYHCSSAITGMYFDEQAQYATA